MNAREVIASALSGDRFNPLEAAVYIEKALTEAGFEIRGGKPCHPRECICAPGDDPPDLCPLGYTPPMTAKPNSELVERAREYDIEVPAGIQEWGDPVSYRAGYFNALESQAAEIARLREALEPFSAKVAFLDNEPPSDRLKKLIEDEETVVEVSLKSCISARLALAETPAGLDRQGPRTDAR